MSPNLQSNTFGLKVRTRGSKPSICVPTFSLFTITLRLHRHRGETTKAIVSHDRLYETLSSCQIDRLEVENVHVSTYNMTRPSPEQQELLERVGLINLLNRDVVELAKSMTNN